MILDALLWGAGVWAVLASISMLIGMIREELGKSR